MKPVHGLYLRKRRKPSLVFLQCVTLLDRNMVIDRFISKTKDYVHVHPCHHLPPPPICSHTPRSVQEKRAQCISSCIPDPGRPFRMGEREGFEPKKEEMKTKRSRPVSINWSIRNEVWADRQTPGVGWQSQCPGDLSSSGCWGSCGGFIWVSVWPAMRWGTPHPEVGLLRWWASGSRSPPHSCPHPTPGFFFGWSLLLLSYWVLSWDHFGGFRVGSFVFILEMAIEEETQK